MTTCSQCGYVELHSYHQPTPMTDPAAERDRLLVGNGELVKVLELALSAFDNSLRSAGTSTAGFIATRKLMAKAQNQARAAIQAHGPAKESAP